MRWSGEGRRKSPRGKKTYADIIKKKRDNQSLTPAQRLRRKNEPDKSKKKKEKEESSVRKARRKKQQARSGQKKEGRKREVEKKEGVQGKENHAGAPGEVGKKTQGFNLQHPKNFFEQKKTTRKDKFRKEKRKRVRLELV